MRQPRTMSALALWGLMAGVIILALAPHPALAHAIPVSYSPAANARLSAAPASVIIRFDEAVNPAGTRVVVGDAQDHQVDLRDSHVLGDHLTLTASLPAQLAPGTYVVGWRATSADDGHITGGSYLFFITNADGTVPTLTNPTITTGIANLLGGSVANGLTPLGALAAVAQWIALLGLTLVLGAIFWWVGPLRWTGAADESRAAIALRLRQLAGLALEAIAGATVVTILAQALAVNASPLEDLRVTLTGGHFGVFILLRFALAALAAVALATPMARGGLRATNQRRVGVLFALALALAFVFSGHGGSSPAVWGPWVDLVHLLANGVWLGGLGVLTLAVLPTLARLPAAERARQLAAGLPAFSVPALACAALLALTGPLNASNRMSGVAQLWTTPYGLVLSLKIALFLAMTAMSAYHAFWLRPRLATALGLEAATTPTAAALTTLRGAFGRVTGGPPADTARSAGRLAFAAVADAPPRERAGAGLALTHAWDVEDLAAAIARWIRREAAVGVVILACAALLAQLAGTLTPPAAAQPGLNTTGGAQTITQTANGLTVTLALTPGAIGDNQVTLTLRGPQNAPLVGATAMADVTMVEMDMGVVTVSFPASGAAGRSVQTVSLPMPGHWRIALRVLAGGHTTTLTFTIAAGS